MSEPPPEAAAAPEPTPAAAAPEPTPAQNPSGEVRLEANGGTITIARTEYVDRS
jgi:hypothetical protein